MAIVTEYGGLGTSVQCKLIDHVLRNTPRFTTGSKPYLALYSSNPTGADTGIELSGSGYSRKPIPSITSGEQGYFTYTLYDIFYYNPYFYNTNGVVFDTATSEWSSVTHMAVRNSLTSGSLIWYAPFVDENFSPTTVVVTTGAHLEVPSAGVVLGISPQMSNYLRQAIGHMLLNDTPFTSPGLNVWLALYTTMPSAADTGGAEVGPSLGYYRTRLSGTGEWYASTSGSTSNINSRNLISSALYDIGDIVGYGLLDASSGGNLLFSDSFYEPIRINAGDSLTLNAGGLKIYFKTPPQES
jgi:hypothetical protein